MRGSVPGRQSRRLEGAGEVEGAVGASHFFEEMEIVDVWMGGRFDGGGLEGGISMGL